MNRKRRLRKLAFDKKRLDFYTDVIVNFYNIATQTEYYAENSSKFHVKQHALGTLYVMQMPFFINNAKTAGGRDEKIPLIPGDEFLYNELPHQNNLKEWKSNQHKPWTYSKGDVTKGRNNLKSALNSIKDHQTVTVDISRVWKRLSS